MSKFGMERVTDEMKGRGQGCTGQGRFVTQDLPFVSILLLALLVLIVAVVVVVLLVSHAEMVVVLLVCQWGGERTPTDMAAALSIATPTTSYSIFTSSSLEGGTKSIRAINNLHWTRPSLHDPSVSFLSWKC